MFVHIHPIMINILPVFFFNPILKSPFSNQAVLRFLSEWHSSVLAPPTIVDWQDCLTLDPAWVSCELSASDAGEDKISLIKRLRCSVVGCSNEFNSRHLLPTSEPLKMQWITFVFEWNAPPDLPKCVYVRTNHLWSSFIYRRNEYKGF